MSTNFPTALDALSNPVAGDALTGHAAQHTNVNDSIEAIEAKVGIDGSAVITTLDYRVAELTTAVALKAPVASPTFTGTVGGITSAMVGLGNATNTSDANKPVSTAQQAALDLKTGFRNMLINGGCSVAQRGSAAVVSGAWVYGGSDRFASLTQGTVATGTIQQYSGVGTVSGFAQGVQATTTGAGSTYTQQRIEGINSRALNGRTVTCSATVFQNTGAALNAQITLGKPTTTLDTFAAQTILSVSGNFSIPTGVPTKISWTYTLGAAEATLGLLAQFGFSAIGAVTSKDFWVGDLQLEAGSLVTPFETRPIGVELALCQRYLLAIPANQFYGSGSMGASGAGSYFFIPTPVCMRVAPSKSGATDVHWVAAGSVLTFGAMSVTTNGLSFVGTHAAVASSGMAGVIYSSGIANYFSAEL